MWMWRICFTSMESLISLKKVLTRYCHRQAVLNFYDDDELLNRDGFFFENIKITDNKILFLNNGLTKAEINLIPFTTFAASNEFKDYYVLKNEISTIEIYFP